MRLMGLVFVLAVTACSSTVQDPAPNANQELAPTTDPPTTGPTDPDTTTTSRATTTEPEETTTSIGVTTTTLRPMQALGYEPIAQLPFPVEMTAREGADLSYVATKDGRVWAYDGTAVSETPVLDISARVRNSGEQGLLSIALHPSEESRFFAHYSAGDGDTVLAEFEMVSGTEIGAGSEQVLLRLDQPARNHNGGMISFGPDARLYLGLGDGGGANDRFGNGQNTGTLLGGLVVLDVDSDADPSLFNYGLRNPWRFWFDQGLVYIADVGQNAYEEVSVTEIAPDINFGWPITEGLHCFRPPSGCDSDGLTLPVLEVRHGDAGTCSITGGIVYRGDAIPEVQGHYFYSDYCGGYLRSFVFEAGEIVEQMEWTEQVGVPGQVTGFGVDSGGEMYVTTADELLKVVPVRG